MSKKVDVELSQLHKAPKERRASADHVNGQAKKILRHTKSHSSLRLPTKFATIREDEEQTKGTAEGLQTLSAANLHRKTSTSSAAIHKNTVRESGRSTKSNLSHEAGSVNRGFADTNSDGDVMSYQSRYSSNQSLSTIKEQYCCSPNCRFTPRERKLCASVAVLATIIVILVIVVGFLAGKNGDRTTFHWKL